MATITIDTHETFEALSRKGFNKEQAEALVSVLKNLRVENVASTQSLGDFKSDMKSDFDRLDRRILEAKFDVLKWVLPLLLGLYGLVLLKLFQ